MHLVLREFDAGRDLDRCVEIWSLGSAVGHPFLTEAERASDAELVRREDLPRAETIVAEESGEVVGYVSLWSAFIGALFVDPRRRRRGVGRRLLEAAAARKGALAVEVYEENEVARRFYEASGFRRVGRKPLDEAERPHPVLRLERAAKKND